VINKVELLVAGQVIDVQDYDFSENIAVDMFAQNVSKSSNGVHPGASARSYFYPLRFLLLRGSSICYSSRGAAVQYRGIAYLLGSTKLVIITLMRTPIITT
jgi:hypothetical protein